MLPGGVGLAAKMLSSAGGMPSLPGMSNSRGAGGIGGGGSSGIGGFPGGGGGQGQIGSAPAAAMRMLNKPPIDATWTEAKDLAPKAAQRMLGQSQRALPDNSPRALPPPPRQLPPPSRFS